MIDTPAFGHGGAREGAGRPSGPTPEATLDYNTWRARNERAKALSAEFELEVQQGKHLPRDVVSAACATAIATFAQSCRGIGDNLERSLGLAPEVSEAISREIDSALEGLGETLRKLTEP